MSVPAKPNSELVVRSEVPAGRPYQEYREYLRPDFFFCCAYCTISESEAGGYRFTIDHYEPQRHRPDLVNVYSNLMYACDPCNVRKGARFPTEAHREKGYRFFRPDQDVYADHFEPDGLDLKERTPIGYYTIRAVGLNRKSLQKLRELRIRATNCNQYVLSGVLGLRKFQLDQLPTSIRGAAKRHIDQMVAFAEFMIDGIDEILKSNSRSPLLDPDVEERTRARQRAVELRQLERALSPGKLKRTKQFR